MKWGMVLQLVAPSALSSPFSTSPSIVNVIGKLTKKLTNSLAKNLVDSNIFCIFVSDKRMMDEGLKMKVNSPAGVANRALM